jgi:multiple sugar transport system permease protein
MRQFMIGVPDDYIDAARIDGASEFGIFWRIVVPLSRPALITLAILTFVGNWDEFLWPLVVTTTDQYRTLPIGLAKFLEAYQNEWHFLMAGAVVAALPLVLLFLVMQRRFLEGMAGLSGLK